MNIVELIGGSGAGKTPLAQKLVEQWPGHATHLRTNRYLRDRRPSDGDDFLMLPSSIDWPLISLHIEMLSRGQRVYMPDYDWERGRRLPPRLQTARLDLEPTNLLIIESLHLIPFEIESAKVFMDAPVVVRRANVIKRDRELNGKFIERFDNVTEPGYQKYTAPLKEKCDLVLDGTLPVDQLFAQARRYLAKRWGGWD